MILNKVAKNAAWIIGAKIIQSLLSFVISSLTARYLGPSDFGVISYAQSIVAFVVPVMQLGLNAILVQEIIQNPNDEGKVLGTSLAMSLVSAVLCITGIIAFVSITNIGETETIIVCALYSLMLISQSLELIQYWFQAKYLSKYTSVTMLVAYLVVTIYKIILLIFQKSVYWFAVSHAIDYFLIAMILYVIYCRLNGKKLIFSKDMASQLFSKGKYYILSGLMVSVFGQTDRVMLKLMIGDTETGLYSAAATCAGVASFFFVAIIDSMRPAIVENKALSQEKYEKSIINLYAIVVYAALAFSLIIFVFANILVWIIYGDQFVASIDILRVLVWYTAFSYYGGAKNVWILVEKKQKYLLILNLCGAFANVLLNTIMIPISGAIGAAIASLITQIFTNVIMSTIIKDLRPNIVMLCKALNPKIILNLGVQLIERKQI